MDGTEQQKELDTFVEAFTEGIEPDVNPESSTPDPVEPEKTETPDENQGKPEQQETPESDDKAKNQQSDKKKDIEEVFSKSDRAFAELRTTNKTQGDFLVRLARLAKIDVKTPAEALEALKKHVETIEAEHGNLTYSEVEKLRQRDVEVADQKAQLKEAANTGFAKLRALHNLEEKDIVAFAGEMKEAGLNPYEAPVDIVAQYRSMHYEQLIEAAKEAGRQEELDRRAKARTQATIPSTRQGGQESDPGEDLNSVDALRAFLERK